MIDVTTQQEIGRWSGISPGDEIYFATTKQRMVVVAVTSGHTVTLAKPTTWVRIRWFCKRAWNWVKRQ